MQTTPTQRRARTPQRRTDFQFQNHGTIWLCRPETPRAITHLAKRCPRASTDHQWFCGCLVIDARYGVTLVTSLRRSGFVCQG